MQHKGHTVSVRYDDTYHMFRPPRAHHCRMTNVVIDRFDHFCPWMGTSIGRRNYRSFVFFLACVSLQLAVTIAFCAVHIAQHVQGERSGESSQRQRTDPGVPSGDSDRQNSSFTDSLLGIIATPILMVVLAGASPSRSAAHLHGYS